MTDVAVDATGVIAEHAVKLDLSAVPDSAVRMARSAFADTVSVLRVRVEWCADVPQQAC
jgi:hypothetical protein